MNEPFIVPVNNQGTEHEFKARFERWGYTHRIAVLIDEITVTFEPDEEGDYRVLANFDQTILENTRADNANLLSAIAKKLPSLSN